MKIRCQTKDTITLTALKQFQGDLKKRSVEDIDNLIASLKEDGLLMPFAVWNDDGNYRILDGHARFEAMIKMAIDEPALLTQELPVIMIEAESDESARAALLQITSQYGRVSKTGMVHFTAPMINYTAPAPIYVKTMAAKASAKPAVSKDNVVLRVEVPRVMVKRLVEVLKGVDGVNVL